MPGPFRLQDPELGALEYDIADPAAGPTAQELEGIRSDIALQKRARVEGARSTLASKRSKFQLAGNVGGAIIGGAAAGPPGAIGGAILGGAVLGLKKDLDAMALEAEGKLPEGTAPPTVGEAFETAGRGMAQDAAFEAAFQGVGVAGKALKRPLVGVTEKVVESAERLKRLGIKAGLLQAGSKQARLAQASLGVFPLVRSAFGKRQRATEEALESYKDRLLVQMSDLVDESGAVHNISRTLRRMTGKQRDQFKRRYREVYGALDADGAYIPQARVVDGIQDILEREVGIIPTAPVRREAVSTTRTLAERTTTTAGQTASEITGTSRRAARGQSLGSTTRTGAVTEGEGAAREVTPFGPTTLEVSTQRELGLIQEIGAQEQREILEQSSSRISESVSEIIRETEKLEPVYSTNEIYNFLNKMQASARRLSDGTPYFTPKEERLLGNRLDMLIQRAKTMGDDTAAGAGMRVHGLLSSARKDVVASPGVRSEYLNLSRHYKAYQDLLGSPAGKSIRNVDPSLIYAGVGEGHKQISLLKAVLSNFDDRSQLENLYKLIGGQNFRATVRKHLDDAFAKGFVVTRGTMAEAGTPLFDAGVIREALYGAKEAGQAGLTGVKLKREGLAAALDIANFEARRAAKLAGKPAAEVVTPAQLDDLLDAMQEVYSTRPASAYAFLIRSAVFGGTATGMFAGANLFGVEGVAGGVAALAGMRLAGRYFTSPARVKLITEGLKPTSSQATRRAAYASMAAFAKREIEQEDLRTRFQPFQPVGGFGVPIPQVRPAWPVVPEGE